MNRYCFALDLKDDPKLIGEYEAYHRSVWPGILQSILDSGIISMEIYRLHTRLFMIMDTGEAFSFEKKKQMDKDNPLVQKWEELMWKYQQALPGARAGDKWILMEKIFSVPVTS